MEKTMKKGKTVAAGAVVLLIISLIGSGVFYISNQALKNSLADEKNRGEALISEKHKLQMETDAFKKEMKTLNGKNVRLDDFLAEASRKLSEKEAELTIINRENGNIKLLKKQIADFNVMKKDFEARLMSLGENNNSKSTEIDLLNKTLSALKEENRQLAANNAILSSMIADNYLVESSKRNIFGKEKLTVVAKRAKKLAVNFKVPENVSGKIHFRIIKPDGSKAEGKDSGIAYRIINSGNDLMASVSNDEIKVTKKIEMTYTPKEKLKPGIYCIELLNGEKHIGSCNIRLR